MSLENKISSFVKNAKITSDYIVGSIKDIAENYIEHPIRNTLAIAGAVSAFGCNLDAGNTDPYSPTDVVAPVISYSGPSEIIKPLGDPQINIVPYLNITDNIDSNVDYTLSVPNFDIDGDGREEIAEGSYLVKAVDSSGNVSELSIPARTAYESGGLENFLNTLTMVENESGERMTVGEAAESLGYFRNMGTNAPNIEGIYSLTGSRMEDGISVYDYGPHDASFSNQNGTSIDIDRVSLYPDSIITGSGDNFTLYYSHFDDDGNPTSANIFIGRKLSSGDIINNNIVFFLNQDFYMELEEAQVLK